MTRWGFLVLSALLLVADIPAAAGLTHAPDRESSGRVEGDMSPASPVRAHYDTFGLPGQGWGGKLGVIVFETEGQYFSGSHVEPLRRCPEEPALECIAFEDVEFAVPRQGFEVGAEWQFNGRRYAASAQTHLQILGAGFDVVIIDASRNARVENVFFFSLEHGLLAYSFYRESIAVPTQTWFLRSLPGLLATRVD
ncbi:hypothetical protein [Alkalisalibacterium limincola]|uniref:Uncharacterized protein n=1 Tax=Alkalisalibacterium limincola TaxID=2699169 RepID=A0A5C8L0B8_9GAMM|nr:hypothetical protein [Alkalisalibacterium limincola]TXK65593.1 hypothetical protein FU658_00175 [Alkalisalibacterium limincola]